MEDQQKIEWVRMVDGYCRFFTWCLVVLLIGLSLILYCGKHYEHSVRRFFKDSSEKITRKKKLNTVVIKGIRQLKGGRISVDVELYCVSRWVKKEEEKKFFEHGLTKEQIWSYAVTFQFYVHGASVTNEKVVFYKSKMSVWRDIVTIELEAKDFWMTDGIYNLEMNVVMSVPHCEWVVKRNDGEEVTYYYEPSENDGKIIKKKFHYKPFYPSGDDSEYLRLRKIENSLVLD